MHKIIDNFTASNNLIFYSWRCECIDGFCNLFHLMPRLHM